jgi:hypothetical protein
MIMNSLLITYIVVGLASINWRMKLVTRSWITGLDILDICGQEPSRQEKKEARSNLLIYGFGFALRFIVTWVLLLLIIEVIGIKVTSIWVGLFIGGVAFVLVVSAISVFMSRVEEVNIFRKYPAWDLDTDNEPLMGYGCKNTDLAFKAWFVPWIIIAFLWLIASVTTGLYYLRP